MTSNDQIYLESVPELPFSIARVWKGVASAGCGKTFTIERAINELIESGVVPSDIGYILYNRDPADEFRSRFIDKGYTKQDLMWMDTHHGICMKLLRVKPDSIMTEKKGLSQWAEEHGFRLRESDNEEDLEGKKTEYGLALDSLDRKIYCGDENLDAIETKLKGFLADTEVKSGKITFSRVIQKCIQMNLVPPVKYLFVDEGQDNGSIQHAYFEKVAQSDVLKGFMMVGDDKQAINEYKGGNHQGFLQFKCDKLFVLPTTYRCSEPVLRFANKIIEPVKERSPITKTSAQKSPGGVRLISEFKECVEGIKNATGKKKSVLILVRNNFVKRNLFRVLHDNGIATKTSQLLIMQDIVYAFQQMKSTGMISVNTLRILMPPESQQDGLSKTAYWPRGFLAAMNKKDIANMTEDQLAVYGTILEAEHDGEGIVCEVSKAPNILGVNKEFMEDVERGYPAVERFTKSKRDACASLLDIIVANKGVVHPVEVSSIHSAKGKEANVVILITNVSRKTKEHEEENPDSERRVWYVGATRAIEALIVTKVNTGSYYEYHTELL